MSSLGLLNWQGNDEYLAEKEAEQQKQRDQQRQLMIESALAGHIRRCWESAKASKRPVEERMLSCLRRVKGEYDPDKLSAIQATGGSAIYMMITSTKTRAAESWVRDILMPVNERPWGLEPTPVAEVPPQIMQQIQMQALQQAAAMAEEQGQQLTQEMVQQVLEEQVDQIKAEAQRRASDAADKMELQIADQLAEGFWNEALEAFISDFAMYPAAVMKGPVLRNRRTFAWAEGWQPVPTMEIRPEFERVSPFDFYPSPDATDIDDGSFMIERVRFRRSDLIAVMDVPGYDAESVREVLRDYGQGGLRDWLWSDGERARLEGRKDDLLNQGETIDGLHYWGGAQGIQLLQWGMSDQEIPDPLAEYQVEAILIGRHCIRCVINDDPEERRPYGRASYNPVSGSFWGIAIPELMADIQDMCNAVARSLANNLAIASGPQVDVAMDRLQPGEDATKIYPWKIWKTKSGMAATGANQKAVNFFQPGSNAAELLNVYNTFEQKADDATNIPRYLYGNERVGGAGNTASGLSMLMESANKGIKAAIGHIDTGVIRRMVRSMWMHNMLYSQDISIKGDLQVIPRGSSAMLQRERAQQMKQQLFETLVNPEVVQQAMGIKGQIELLRSVTAGAGILNLIPEGVEDQIEASMSQPNPADELAMAELEAKVQKIQAETQRIAADAESKNQKLPVEVEQLQAQILKLLAEVQRMAGDTANAQRQAAAALRAAPVNRSIQAGTKQPVRMESPSAMAGAPQSQQLGLAAGGY